VRKRRRGFQLNRALDLVHFNNSIMHIPMINNVIICLRALCQWTSRGARNRISTIPFNREGRFGPKTPFFFSFAAHCPSHI
jgi:hypothetical protein